MHFRGIFLETIRKKMRFIAKNYDSLSKNYDSLV